MNEKVISYFLTALDGPAFGREFVLRDQGEITVGRTDENDIALPDQNISRHHATFWIQNGTLWVQDLTSKNGTFLNDMRIRKSILEVNDIIRLGTSSFRIGADKPKLDLEQVEKIAQEIKPHLLELFEKVSKNINQKRFALYGSTSLLLLMFFFGMNKQESSPIVVSPPKVLEANFTEVGHKRASQDDLMAWQGQAEQALRFNDFAAAIPLLQNVLSVQPENLRARAQLEQAQAQWVQMVQKYIESGDREFEKMYYERALQEWQKVLSLSEGIEPTIYKQTEEKIKNVESKLSQKRAS